LANEGDTADINSVVVPAMSCSPTLCRCTYFAILLRNKGPYSVNLLETRLLL